MSDSIRAALLDVRSRIATAAVASGRRPEDVRLLAVSKTQPLGAVEEAFAAGQFYFGENYVQEAVEKARSLPAAEWHLIGTLQTNKVKQICGPSAPSFGLIHSVDRAKLAVELDRCSEGRPPQDILMQIHIGDEETKHGVGLDDAEVLIEKILDLKNLRLRGVMALPPLGDELVSRANFASLRSAFEGWRTELPAVAAAHFDQLSIGTSSDFIWAIQEGANLVRVGTAIFGQRTARGR